MSRKTQCITLEKKTHDFHVKSLNWNKNDYVGIRICAWKPQKNAQFWHRKVKISEFCTLDLFILVHEKNVFVLALQNCT